MEKVFNRSIGDQISGDASMLVKDGSGKVRTKSFNARIMISNKDARIYLDFQAPVEAKGTRILTHDYNSAEKTDDQWIYLPKLKKSTRIASGNRSGSFMGGDFSYADMTQTNPASYNYKILQESSKVGSTDCWLIGETPTTQAAASETGYAKSQHWVAKDTFIILQSKTWEYNSSRIKYIKYEDIRKIKDTFIVHKFSAQTQNDGKVESDTVVQFSNVNLASNQFTQEDFSTRKLEH